MRNTRPCMEDRITACASFHEAELKKNSLLTLSDDVEENEVIRKDEHVKRSEDSVEENVVQQCTLSHPTKSFDSGDNSVQVSECVRE